jgi:hypothetical protein
LLDEEVIKRGDVLGGRRVGGGSYLSLFIIFILLFFVTS